MLGALLLVSGIYAVVEVDDSGGVTVPHVQRVAFAAPVEASADRDSEWSAVVVADGRERARVPVDVDDAWRVEYDGGGRIASSRGRGTKSAVVRLPDHHGRLEIHRRGQTLASVDVQNTVAAAEADLVTIGSSGDPRNRLDLLLLGDGYTAAERDKFFADARKLMQSFFSISPYREYAGFVNTVALFTPSAQSGADHPQCSDPASNGDPKRGTIVDTAFDATYCGNGTFRGVTIDAGKVYAAAAAYPEWDRVGVLVNDDTYGGSGGPVWVVSTNARANEIAQHEFGHSFSGLTDEYTSPWSGATFCSDVSGLRACEPNATDETSREKLKWAPWVEAATPIPTPPGLSDELGLFQGARYQTTGFYRPRFGCLMNLFRADGLPVPFCEICREAFVLRLYEGWTSFTPQKIRLIENPVPSTPVSAGVGMPVTFAAAPLQTANGTIRRQWSVNGAVADADGEAFTFTPAAAGTYEVRLVVTDVTPFVRGKPLSVSHTWQMAVGAPRAKRRAARQ